MRAQIARSTSFLTIVGIISSIFLPVAVQAHGGEDHGDAKPKTTANAKGVISHSSRLGEIEVMVKHPAMEPDRSTTGLLFVTRFETNEPFKPVDAKVELEAASGSIFTATVATGEQAGTYNVAFPAMPAGVYTMRANISHDGETDTATFSGIDVKPASPTAGVGSSWFSGTLIGVVFLVVISLLIGLVYFVWRFAASPGVNEEALSV
jgi:cobalt-zinc-cadmium efflux system membrane fusion protein